MDPNTGAKHLQLRIKARHLEAELVKAKQALRHDDITPITRELAQLRRQITELLDTTD